MAGINDLFKKYYDQLNPIRQTLSGMASNAQNILKNPVKAVSELPDQVRAGRQLFTGCSIELSNSANPAILIRPLCC